MTSDHRVAGSSPAGCKLLRYSDLRIEKTFQKSGNEERIHVSSTLFEFNIDWLGAQKRDRAEQSKWSLALWREPGCFSRVLHLGEHLPAPGG
jgi:hypothetical protein